MTEKGELLPGLSLEDFIEADTAADQELMVLFLDGGERKLQPMQWGLIRHDNPAGVMPRVRPKHIRSERLFDSPFTRPAAEKRRGVALTDTLYYASRMTGHPRRCTIRRVDRGVICLPAIWEPSATQQGRRLTCALVSVPGSHLVEHVQDWMAAVIEEGEEVDTWLEQEFQRDRLEALLRPYAGTDLKAA